MCVACAKSNIADATAAIKAAPFCDSIIRYNAHTSMTSLQREENEYVSLLFALISPLHH